MELGNLFFGNSRGPIPFLDRDLVNCEEWEYLVHTLLQVEDYHCSLGTYYQDYRNPNLPTQKRKNNLIPEPNGGFICKYNNQVIFEINPYYWGDCDCGVDEINQKNEELILNKMFTLQERKIYESYEDYCDDECPADKWNISNENKSENELLKICTCGCVKRNIKLREDKNLLKNKMEIVNKTIEDSMIEHKKNCSLLKHNFIYHPKQKDEFWIDWYKYPFRDSYMNRNISEDELKKIWTNCSIVLKKIIKQNNGKW